MKKSLSFLVALALVFGLFASMASAADTSLTTAQKYQQFLDKGILKGDPSGDPRLSANLNRAEFVTIADAVNGLAPVNSAVATFSDVKKGQWWYGAIEAAAKAGLVNGIGLGKFGPKLNVTVEQAIKVFVLSAGLKPVDGAKVEGSSDWAGPFIKAAQDANFPVPSNYKANATRGQAIDLAYAAYLAKAVPTLSDVTAVANSDDTITVSGKVVGTVDKVTVALGTATPVAATLKDDGSFTYTTDKQAAGDYKITVVAYEGTKASAAVEKTVTVDAFSVVSATVQNSSQIVVKFNKTVQEGTLPGGHSYKNASNVLEYYKLGATVLGATYYAGATSVANTSYPTVATLSDDKTTVTLTFPPFANNTVAQLNIKGLKSASGKDLVEYKQAILLADVTAPSVDKVTYAGNTANVTFSEPIADGYVVSVNGVQVNKDTPSIAGAVYYTVSTSSTGYVTLTFKNLEGGKSYNVSLVGVKDFAVPANRANLTTTLNVPDDTTPPTITSVVAEGSNIRVKFSERLDDATGFKVTDGIHTQTFTGKQDSTTLEAVVSLRGWVSSNYTNVTLTFSDYYDLVGNKGAKFSQALTLTKDTTAPAVSSVLVSGSKIVIKFNESIVSTSYRSGKIDFTSSDFVRKTNVTLAGTFAYEYDANGNGSIDSGEDQYLVIDVTSPEVTDATTHLLLNGSYTLTLPAGAVSDGFNANSSDLTVNFTVTGNTAAANAVIKLVSVTQDPTDPSKLTFNFSGNKDLLATTALDPAKFFIDGAAIPADSKLYFWNNAINNVSVGVELASGAIPANGTRVFSVANIIDKAGNTLDGDSSSVATAVIFKENIKPTVVSAAVTGDNEVTVTLSENVTTGTDGSPVSVNGVEVWVNNNKVDSNTLKVYSFANSNVLKIVGNANTFAAGQSVEVKFVGASGIKDLNKNSVVDASVRAQ